MKTRALVALASVLATQSPAIAAPFEVSPNGRAVYDRGHNITWTADANLARSDHRGVAGVGRDGSMDFKSAQAFVKALRSSRYLNSDQWRLPTSTMPDDGCSQNPKTAAFGYGCTSSELGDLFYTELGGARGAKIGQTHNANYNDFRNVQPYLYWSGTLWKKVKNSAFSFSFENGFQGTNVFANDLYVLAVAPGKVGFGKSGPGPPPGPPPRPKPPVGPCANGLHRCQ